MERPPARRTVREKAKRVAGQLIYWNLVQNWSNVGKSKKKKRDKVDNVNEGTGVPNDVARAQSEYLLSM